MSVKDRLKKFIEFEEVTISSFEKSINASNGYVNSISKSVGLDKLELILEKYPKLDLNWLLTGKGSMLKEGSVAQGSGQFAQNVGGSVSQVQGNGENSVSLSLQQATLLELKEQIKDLKDQIKVKDGQIASLLSALNK